MPTLRTASLSIPISGVTLEGDLTVPPSAHGIVVFAHGSGSSRHSSRNRRVASLLVAGGLATLLFDLLTAREEAIDERTTEFRFDIPMLSNRLVQVTDWLRRQPQTGGFRVGYFGASTGAAAALIAASERPEDVAAVVSRGGRPDLAGGALAQVRAPTLLIVGGADSVVLDLNRQAYERLQVERALEIVPHATHLFEEPGALDEVARIALAWFQRYLQAADRSVILDGEGRHDRY